MLDGVTPFPAEFAARYRDLGYWEDRPLFDGFTAALARYSGRVALADETGPVTYRQLGERSEHLARALLDQGFKPLDRIIVQLPNTAMFAIFYFALQRIGAVPVLALPGHRKREITQFAEISGARALAVPAAVRGFDFTAMAAKIMADRPDLRLCLVQGMNNGPNDARFVRLENLINRGGEKISAEEVENLILAHQAVLNVACVPYPDPVLGERMCACVVLRPGRSLNLEELVTFLRGFEIATFKLPERLECLDTLPLSGFGKVSKEDLAAQLAGGA